VRTDNLVRHQHVADAAVPPIIPAPAASRADAPPEHRAKEGPGNEMLDLP